MSHRYITSLLAVAVLALAAGCGPTAPTSPARTVRFPTSGVPAFVVDLPAGWASSTDKYNNFELKADDGCCSVQLTMNIDPASVSEPIEQSAAEILKGAGAAPYSMRVYDALGGLPAQSFVSKMNSTGSDITLTLAKIDAGHMAVAARITRADQPDAQARAKDLVTIVRIVQQ